MICVKNLRKSFGSQLVLDNINLEVQDGELLVILGESGTGKSVLLKHLMGLLRPDQGSVEIDGKDITKLSEKELLPLRKNIGYLFQEGALYDFMDVFENIAFPLREHTSYSREVILKKVRDVLALIGLDDIEGKYPSELSGGMKKRVALARAIILDSKILFCDEPTSGLDPVRSRDISDLIKTVSRKYSCTTVMTSHDIHNAMRIGDRLVLMHDGRIISSGTPEQFKDSDVPFVRDFVVTKTSYKE